MKKLLLGLLVLVVLLIGVAVALPFVLPREMIKAELEQRLTAELGREVQVDGPLELRPWRPMALTLSDVSVANPDWANAPTLASIDRLVLDVDALAYLGGTIALDQLLIERPTLALEIAPDGTPSWQLGPAPEAAGDAHGGGDTGPMALPNVRIGEIRITEGTVIVDDHATGEARRFEALELWARSEPESPALNLDGSVTSAGERATLNAVIGDLDALLAGEPSSLGLEAAAPGLGIAAEGEAAPSGSAVLAVTADAAPRRLLDWLGQPVELPEGRLEAVTLNVDMAAAPTGLALRALNLAVDELVVTGDLELALAERPKLSGSLDLGDLDLRPYLPRGDDTDSATEPAESAASRRAGRRAKPAPAGRTSPSTCPCRCRSTSISMCSWRASPPTTWNSVRAVCRSMPMQPRRRPASTSWHSTTARPRAGPRSPAATPSGSTPRPRSPASSSSRC